MTLTDFLLARIAEDEAVAQAAVKEADWEHGDGWADYVGNAGQYASPHSDFAAHANWPRVVLAECEAKRRIVEELSSVSAKIPVAHKLAVAPLVAREYGLEFAAKALALPYADHPDYREDWKP